MKEFHLFASIGGGIYGGLLLNNECVALGLNFPKQKLMAITEGMLRLISINW